jgi:hypothetical protein
MINVYSQEALDEALAKTTPQKICICENGGPYFYQLASNPNKHIIIANAYTHVTVSHILLYAFEAAHVYAATDSLVYAMEDSLVIGYDNACVVATETSTVWAMDTTRVHNFSDQATIHACDNSIVYNYSPTTSQPQVELNDSAHLINTPFVMPKRGEKATMYKPATYMQNVYTSPLIAQAFNPSSHDPIPVHVSLTKSNVVYWLDDYTVKVQKVSYE